MATIVVIDDEQMVRVVIRRALLLDGHTVADADTAAAGRWLVWTQEPELVIVDLGLAVDDGIAAMLDLRRTRPRLRLLAIRAATPGIWRRACARQDLRLWSEPWPSRSTTKAL